jgi:hypothetical protein
MAELLADPKKDVTSIKVDLRLATLKDEAPRNSEQSFRVSEI